MCILSFNNFLPLSVSHTSMRRDEDGLQVHLSLWSAFVSRPILIGTENSFCFGFASRDQTSTSKKCTHDQFRDSKQFELATHIISSPSDLRFSIKRSKAANSNPQATADSHSPPPSSLLSPPPHICFKLYYAASKATACEHISAIGYYPACFAAADASRRCLSGVSSGSAIGTPQYRYAESPTLRCFFHFIALCFFTCS